MVKKFVSMTSSPKLGQPRYELLVEEANTNKRKEARTVKIFVAILSLICALVVGILIYANSTGGDSREASAAARTGSTFESGFNIKQNWGSYSPYFDSGVPFDGVSKSALEGEYTLPTGCTYRQVHLLHRHGDRYPAPGTYEHMVDVANKLANMSQPARGDLSWLNDWEYTLGIDDLVSTGVASLFSSGAKFWGTHGRLLYGHPNQTSWNPRHNVYPNGTSRPTPYVRAAGQQRVVDSALAWAAGFFGEYGQPPIGGNINKQYNLDIIPEEEGQNNTLAGYFSCPNSETKSIGSKLKKEFIDIYLADATVRLQRALPGIANLTTKDALAIQDLCVFETAAYGQSAFCNLFTELEWRGFEYHIDLKFWGDSAWGNPAGPATGLGWIAELYGRLTSQKPKGFGVNETLPFIPDQPLHADFTHDSVIASVLSALRFQWTIAELPSTKIKVPRQFIVSRLTPFAAKLVVEILSCKDGERVRMKLNDRVLPLGDLHYCPVSDDGICPLKDFTRSLKHILQSSDYDALCYR